MQTPQSIRDLAIQMAKEVGLINLTRQALCARANIKDGSFPVIAGCTFTELVASIRPDCPMVGSTKVSKSRTSPELRKEHILAVTLNLCEQEGKMYNRITCAEIAEVAGIAERLVRHYFGTMTDLRRDIMRHAIIQKRLPIIAQGLAAGDPHAKKAPQELKDLAVASLATA